MENNLNQEKVQFPEIANKINSMTQIDQDMRKQNIKDKEYWDENIDKKNTLRMKKIVEEIGWPNTSKVGEKASHNAWLLVQHADHDIDFQKQCLDLMKIEPIGEIELGDIAYLEDRVRLKFGQPQLYGTQFTEVDGKFVPKNLEDPDNVDERRKAMGLSTIAEGIEEICRKYEMKKSE